MKKIAVFLSFLLLLLCFFGCKANDPSGNLSQPEQSNDKTVSNTVSSESSDIIDESDISSTVSLDEDESIDISDSFEEPAVKDVYKEGYVGSEKTLLLKVGYGEKEDKIAFDPAYKSKDALSAENFIIEDGQFHILDSFADAIKVYDESGKFVRSIYFNEYAELGTPELLAYNGDTYAVLYRQWYSLIDIETGETQKPDVNLLYITEDGTKEIYCLNDLLTEYSSHFTINAMEFEGDSLILASNEAYHRVDKNGEDITVTVIEPYCNSKFVGSEFGECIITVADDAFIIPRGDDATFDYSKTVSSMDLEYVGGYVYVSRCYSVTDKETLDYVSERSLTKYDKKGNIVEYAIIGDYEKTEAWAENEFFIDEDGKVYFMSCRKDALYIFEVEMGNTAISTAIWLVENK